MLLLDQNLSYRLLDELAPLFPGSTQAKLVGLDRADDRTVWRYAGDNNLAIVTKDSDFHEFALVFGHPPEIIWLKCGNRPRSYVLDVLRNHREEIKAFLDDDDASCLEVY